MMANTYERPFFYPLIASQLDCDRLDYLLRDSFFTGVIEGSIGAERLIQMLDIDEAQGQIVVEEKGMYSVENFLNSRRLMYWQVYLHKTTVCAEEMLIRLIRRAKALLKQGEKVPAPDHLAFFFKTEVALADFASDPDLLERYAQLDDADLWTCIKQWQRHPDTILSYLSKCLVDRRLFRVTLSLRPPEVGWQERARARIAAHFAIDPADADYLLVQGQVQNQAYLPEYPIYIKRRSGFVQELTEASDLPHIAALAQPVVKFYACWPKEIGH
jgi:HD superfamily phosphohydrolase